MVNKKIVIICSVITLIIVGIVVGINIKNFKDSQNKMNEVGINKVSIGNENSNDENRNENITSEENEIVEEKNEETTNTSNQEQIKGEEEKRTETTDNSAENTNLSGENNNEEESGDEAAINLVKNEWGADDATVYYTIDTQSNYTYTISVRSKSTTAQLAEYDVDLKNKKVDMK